MVHRIFQVLRSLGTDGWPGAERDGDTEAEATQFGDMLFTDDRLSGYRSIVHKTYWVLEHAVRGCPNPS